MSPLEMNLLNYFYNYYNITQLNLESVDFHLWGYMCGALQSVSIKLSIYSR